MSSSASGDKSSNSNESDNEEEEEDYAKFLQADLIYQPESELRQWLIKHGKSDFIVFKDD